MIWVVTLDLSRTVQRYSGQKVLLCVIPSVLRLANMGYYSKGGVANELETGFERFELNF